MFRVRVVGMRMLYMRAIGSDGIPNIRVFCIDTLQLGR